MKKMAIFINKFEDRDFTSGGEKVNFLILKAFSELGVNFDVFCNEKIGKDTENFFNIYEGQSDLLLLRKSEGYYDLVFSENYNVSDVNYVHENSRAFRNAVILSPFTRFIKRVFSPKRWETHKSALAITEVALNAMKRVIVPSGFIEDDLVYYSGCNPDKISIISPPVDLPQFVMPERENEIFTFGLVARSFELKGGYDFLFALALLKFHRINFKAKIIAAHGEKSNKVDLILFLTKALGISNNVEFCDYGSDIGEFYSSVDCVAMPSKRDAFGLIAAEAMSCGLPVIISSRCGVKDYINDGENGFIYDYGKNNFIKLYKKMLFVIQNDMQLIKRNAKSTSVEFSFENFKNKLKDVIDSL